MEKKLEVKDLRISFRTQGGLVKAVRGIDFDLYKGETLAIVGESGSGKSVTVKAILGILAGNSIVESGEILYDGMDLLKIGEDDFHTIRGDRIAMIFQDPLSSLNPIIRIGKQLTEAMILKSNSNKRRNRKLFNGLLDNIKKNLKISFEQQPESLSASNESLAIFKKFAILGNKLESAFQKAYQTQVDVQGEIEDVLLNIEKLQKVDFSLAIRKVVVKSQKVYNIFSIREDSRYAEIVASLKVEAKDCGVGVACPLAIEHLKEAQEILRKSIDAEQPDFFTLGYYLFSNPEFDVISLSVEELNKLTRSYIEENFLRDFTEHITVAIKNSYYESLEFKKEAVVKMQNAVETFKTKTLDKKYCEEIRKETILAVNKSIDHMQVKKDTRAYTFGSSFSDAIKKYFSGVSKNPKEQERYDKQSEKYARLIESGKTPDWKVAPAKLVDLDIAHKNILAVLTNLIEIYEVNIREDVNYDFNAQCADTIDFLKERASGIVYTITPALAREKAIKLMEEVGIADARKRYRQYPFEFSGGMRQRIVIAIALAANPDILICDEPTTALDVTIQAQILELINNLKKDRNLSVIFITHDLGVVANMANRIAVMYAGKIVEYGTSEEIFYDPRHPYTWALLSSMPDLETSDKLDAIPGTPPNMIYPPKGDAFAIRNKYALRIDFEKEPPMFKVANDHYAATWLLHPDAPKVDPPKLVTDRIMRMKEEGEKNNG